MNTDLKGSSHCKLTRMALAVEGLTLLAVQWRAVFPSLSHNTTSALCKSHITTVKHDKPTTNSPSTNHPDESLYTVCVVVIGTPVKGSHLLIISIVDLALQWQVLQQDTQALSTAVGRG